MAGMACRAILMCVPAFSVGCQQPPRSTMMTVEDYQGVAADVAAKLKADFAQGALAARTPDSPPMVIAVQKVANYTSDLMSPGAKWYMMSKVSDELSRELLHQKNIVFVLPAEFLAAAKAMGAVEPGAMPDRAPTHVMTAVFRSVTRSTEKERTEAYLCDYEIRSLADGEVVWSGQAELKRWAHGRAWD